ncbi:MAG: ammonium transporter [Chloroflexi bacterium]|nr:MAG: ammonium transporter [Chloroflexota bacterium]
MLSLITGRAHRGGDILDTGDTAWMLTSSALVLFMTPGLALFYGGMVRAKNALGMLLKNYIAMGVVTITWVVIGYTLAFGPDLGGGMLGGLDYLGLKGVSSFFAEGQTKGSIHGLPVSDTAVMVFQMMFAIITPALISGALAERMKFTTWVVFIALWSVVVYAPVAHWVWAADGFIFRDVKAVDFAGGTVVHISAGAAALAVIFVLGPRLGFRREVIRPHNLPLTLLGAGMLWFGWFGFNAGSALGANGLAVNAFVTTQIGAAVAGTVWALMEQVQHGKPTTLGFASGAVAGLVAITPGAGFVSPMGAIAIGAAAGVVCYLALQIKFKFNFDDALDVVAVHLVGGVLGSLLVGVFALNEINAATENGLLYGGGMTQLIRQASAVIVVFVYSFGVSWVLARVLHAIMGLRVSEVDERRGIDLSLHEEQSYVLAE